MGNEVSSEKVGKKKEKEKEIGTWTTSNNAERKKEERKGERKRQQFRFQHQVSVWRRNVSKENALTRGGNNFGLIKLQY